MRPLVPFLQGKLSEAYCGFKKIEEIIHIYEETRGKTDNDFNQYMPKQLGWLINLVRKRNTHVIWTVGKSEKRSFRCDDAILTKINILLFLDVTFTEMKPRFSREKNSRYGRCRVIPEVVN